MIDSEYRLGRNNLNPLDQNYSLGGVNLFKGAAKPRFHYEYSGNNIYGYPVLYYHANELTTEEIEKRKLKYTRHINENDEYGSRVEKTDGTYMTIHAHNPQELHLVYGYGDGLPVVYRKV